jgi:hypothetical protein
VERLNALDAEFLHLEGGIVHMHIAGIAVLGNPAPPFRDLETLITSKLHVIPRYRQRIRSVPFELGRPVWVDDPHFDLGYHLRHTALPAPGDDAAFCRLVGRIMSQPRGALKVLDAWGGLASDTLAIARDVPGSVTHPAAALHSAPETAQGAVRNGSISFCVTGDFATMPDVGLLATAIATGIDDLKDRALAQLGQHRSGRARARRAG